MYLLLSMLEKKFQGYSFTLDVKVVPIACASRINNHSIVDKTYCITCLIYSDRHVACWKCHAKRGVSFLSFKGQVCSINLFHVFLSTAMTRSKFFCSLYLHRIEESNGEASAGRSPSSLTSGSKPNFIFIYYVKSQV